MTSQDGRFWLSFNGEIYNYLELREQLRDYRYRTRSDTEVVLAAFERWGPACLDRFIGMFAFVIWDTRDRRLFAARDRFGVKPLHYHTRPDGTLLMASEIKALHAAGVPREPNDAVWALYLSRGLAGGGRETFWRGIRSLPPGHALEWRGGETRTWQWYDLACESGALFDPRPAAAVADEYAALLDDSVRLRFRADVPVGVTLSGGLDSSILLAAIDRSQRADQRAIKAFTFVTGDPAYDELPWVAAMLAGTGHPLIECRLSAADVPALAASVQASQDEPFGGVPTLAYAKVFERARREGVIVLLDGQGLDEQWAGYDYYRRAVDGPGAPIVQGASSSAIRAECLVADFERLAEPPLIEQPFADALRNLQYRDIAVTKMPRALRFNDRVSMRASTELREPFLDHRLFELALRQPAHHKIRGGSGKWLVRDAMSHALPHGVSAAPKRAVQTPQREWLRGPLREWAAAQIEVAIDACGGTWLEAAAVRGAWRSYLEGDGDNSFFVWQWISIGLMAPSFEATQAA
jgi:asparagine synthase (glutamine-hydrolysing)